MFSILVFFSIFAVCYCKSYYDILGIPISADSKDIKKAYYQLALTLHPDKLKNPTEEDKNRYVEIVKAYEILSDPEKRKQYDLLGDDSENEIIYSNSYTDQLFSFKAFSSNYRFEAFYTPHTLQLAPPIVISYSISISDLYTGISHKILYFNRTSFCPVCNATGSDSYEHIHTCDFCRGTGFREYPTLYSSHAGISYSTICDQCHGSGYKAFSNHTCPYCHGSGLRIIEDSLDLNLLPGTRSSYQSVYHSFGNEQFQRKRGDVIVKLIIKPHPVFQVDDYVNLHMNSSLSLQEALFGFERMITLPNNESTIIKKSIRTADGSVMIVKNLGIPIGATGMKGSLFVHFSVLFPVVMLKNDKEMIMKYMGNESEEVIEFIEYHSDLLIQKISDDLGYPFSSEEVIYSNQTSTNQQCIFSIVNLSLY